MEVSFIADHELETKILAWFAKHGYVCTEIGLATKPKSRHFHVKKTKEKGTLELTVTPSDNPKLTEYEFVMRSNRYSAWGLETFDVLCQKFDLIA